MTATLKPCSVRACKTCCYLCGDGRELKSMQCLVVTGTAGINVDHHAGAAMPREETLQYPGQFTVSERNDLCRTLPTTQSAYSSLSVSVTLSSQGYYYIIREE